MIDKIIGSMIFVSCLFALLLSLNGVEAPLWFGNEFRGFIVATNQELSTFHIAIPDIPYIENISYLTFTNNAWANVIVVLNNFFMGFSQFLNGIVTILNFFILVINTIINLIVFIFVFLKNVITLKDTIVA